MAQQVLLSCILAAGLAAPAMALDGKVYSSVVVKNEADLEYAGTDTFDSDKSKMPYRSISSPLAMPTPTTGRLKSIMRNLNAVRPVIGLYGQ